ncbi:MAG TPA: hypothetical protein VKB18_03940 [Gemmatimonadota bacterium]|nr:hypothetical protein [Gemmatimonadota bacterium]
MSVRPRDLLSDDEGVWYTALLTPEGTTLADYGGSAESYREHPDIPIVERLGEPGRDLPGDDAAIRVARRRFGERLIEVRLEPEGVVLWEAGAGESAS